MPRIYYNLLSLESHLGGDGIYHTTLEYEQPAAIMTEFQFTVHTDNKVLSAQPRIYFNTDPHRPIKKRPSPL